MKLSGQYIAAVSGGPDSMALLSQYRDNVVMVAHVNYNVRETSKRDRDLVEGYCSRHNIPFRCLDVTERMLEKAKRDISNNFEAVAREIRYSFFASLVKEANTDQVLVAHNLDDFVETALMQRNRKSVSLFYGIKDTSSHHGIKIIRPLIDVRKQELIAYCNERDVPYAIDETNDDDIRERNKFRKSIALWPPIVFNIIVRMIKTYNKQNEEKSNLVNDLYDKWAKTEYAVEHFKSIQQDVLPYIVYKYLIDNNLGYISSSKISSVTDFLLKSDGNKLYRLEKDTYIKLR